LTFVAVAGAKPRPDRPLDGINLIPLVAGEQPEATRTFFWRIDRPSRQQKAIRHGPWKYVFDGGYVHLLFNLDDDVGERRNLAIHHPRVMRDLQQRLQAWEAEMDAEEKEILVR
jgi:arylsulfatase A-like enzyme